jgi:hypothetical protein
MSGLIACALERDRATAKGAKPGQDEDGRMSDQIVILLCIACYVAGVVAGMATLLLVRRGARIDLYDQMIASSRRRVRPMR